MARQSPNPPSSHCLRRGRGSLCLWRLGWVEVGIAVESLFDRVPDLQHVDVRWRGDHLKVAAVYLRIPIRLDAVSVEVVAVGVLANAYEKARYSLSRNLDADMISSDTGCACACACFLELSYYSSRAPASRPHTGSALRLLQGAHAAQMAQLH